MLLDDLSLCSLTNPNLLLNALSLYTLFNPYLLYNDLSLYSLSNPNLYLQEHYTESDCTFREVILEDGYTHFLSMHHGLPISLAPRHSGKQGHRFSRFLPLRSSLSEERASAALQTPQTLDLDSGDPLGMGLGALLSPAFSMDT